MDEQKTQLDELSSRVVEAGLATWAGSGSTGHLIVRGQAKLLDDVTALSDLERIRALFEALRREQEGVVEARIISALPIAEEQVRPLLDALERKYGRKVNAQVEIEPELIGGVRIIVGDKVIDATVRGRLESMAVALAH